MVDRMVNPMSFVMLCIFNSSHTYYFDFPFRVKLFSYSMETERAFQNEIIKVLDRNKNQQIHASDVRVFINNIGAMDKIGHDEIEFAVSEIGGGSDTASIDKMRSFLSS